jgi:DegV family protein with EDD domain
MAVHIVTDSACDLTAEQVAEYGITVVPLTIRFGDDEFVDREQLSIEDFYKRMADFDGLPETSAPSPGAFEVAFRNAVAAGADAVVCITLSGALSATIEAARAAQRSLDGEIDVRVIDSLSITAGLGTQVIEAARAARAGRSADEIEAVVTDLVVRTDIFATLDTLDNLKKGGRIGGAQAMLGGLLSIKPMIRIKDGSVEEAGKHRTRRKSLEALRDLIYEQGEVSHVVVAHGEAPDIDDFLDMIAERYPRDQITVGKIGAVIGTHGGPRIIGCCFAR